MARLFGLRLVGAITLAAALGSSPASSLEKTLGRADTERSPEWKAGTATCSVAYYNICTGYVWMWSGWLDRATFGTVFESCCGSDGSTLVSNMLHFRRGAPHGWGFTGAVSLYAVDELDCPTGAPLATHPFLPPGSGWLQVLWGVEVPSRFVIQYEARDRFGWGIPIAVSSDGPFACGACYPTTRTTNSYTWGTSTSPLCPGAPHFDGDCYVEWLAVAHFQCATVSVENASWGQIKNLYR